MKIEKPFPKPELVAPAGDWPALVTAVDSGADSVYFGVKGINMRHLASNFDILEIKKVMKYLHDRNRKGYLVLNVIIKDDDCAKVAKIFKEAKKALVDAVVLWDMAAFYLAKECGLKIHMSTQASIANSRALEQYAKLGVKRAVLARECTLEDIKKIVKFARDKKIACEIEAFIHGAMCISVSGRCFLSAIACGKSANQGECLQYCRREFTITDESNEANFVLGQDYVLSAKDLCSIDFIDELIFAGINSFKIEGRMRSPEYVRVVTSAYRKAINAFYSGELTPQLKESLKNKLLTVFNRGFSSGLYFGAPQDALSRANEHTHEKVFLGTVKKYFKKIGVAEILVQNSPLSQGEKLLIMGKKTPASFVTAQQLQQKHEFVKIAEKGSAVGVKLPFPVKPKDKVFIWRKK